MTREKVFVPGNKRRPPGMRSQQIAGLIYIRKYHVPRIEGQYRASMRAPGTGGTSFGYGHTAQEALDNLAKVPTIIDKMLEDIINSDKPPEERWSRSLSGPCVKLTYVDEPRKTFWQWLRGLFS